MGYNNNFGNHREGNRTKIASSEAFSKVKLEEVPALYYEGEAISSSRIRKTIEAGDILLSNTMLGYAYPAELVSLEHTPTGQTCCKLTNGDKVFPRKGRYTIKINQTEKQIYIEEQNIYLSEKIDLHQTFNINIINKN